jgi:hypothetical protein
MGSVCTLPSTFRFIDQEVKTIGEFGETKGVPPYLLPKFSLAKTLVPTACCAALGGALLSLLQATHHANVLTSGPLPGPPAGYAAAGAAWAASKAFVGV